MTFDTSGRRRWDDGNRSESPQVGEDLLTGALGAGTDHGVIGPLGQKCLTSGLQYGGFHSHGGTPIAGWFLLGKIPLKGSPLEFPLKNQTTRVVSFRFIL